MLFGGAGKWWRIVDTTMSGEWGRKTAGQFPLSIPFQYLPPKFLLLLHSDPSPFRKQLRLFPFPFP